MTCSWTLDMTCSWTLDMDPGYGPVGLAIWTRGTGYMDPWAWHILWLGPGNTRLVHTGVYPCTTPGTPLPHPPYMGCPACTPRTPAQRLAISVKAAVSGTPIYRRSEKRLSECNGERTQGSQTCQNVPTFLIEQCFMRFLRWVWGRGLADACI